jgi:hypothetical protein
MAPKNQPMTPASPNESGFTMVPRVFLTYPCANPSVLDRTQYDPVEFVLFRNGGETMRRYHHIGIPTSQPRPGERHIEHLKVFIVGHENSEYGVEWMRFEADAPIPELVRQVPHVAFEVSDLASELVGREILIAPNSPSDGVRVAFIVENGAPIELLEFTNPNHPDRR